MARKLSVEIVGDASSLERAFGRAGKSSSGLGRSLVSLGKVAALGVGAAFVGLGAVVRAGFDEIGEGQKVAAQTGAVLKSTGNSANVSAKEIDGLAQSLSKMSGRDDEAVQAGENMLLTFTKVRNEVGKGNDIFTQSTKTLLDMSQALGTDMNKSAIQLGKALNDPIKGITALTRVGVTFDEGQKKQIKSMVESGNVMGAQKLILAELNKEFGGSAKAFGETMPGQISKLKNSFEEVAASVAEILLPYLMRLLQWTNDHMPEIEAVITSVLNAIVSTIEFIGPIISKLIGWFQTLSGASQKYWPQVRAVIEDVINWFKTNIVPTVAAVVSALIALWRRFGDEIMAVVGPVFKIIFTLIETTMKSIKAVIETVMAVIRGDWSKAWDSLKSLVSGVFNGIKSIITTALGSLVPAVLSLAVAIGRAIVGGLLRGLANLASALAGKLAAIGPALAGVAGQAAGWAASIGQAIVRGILSGMSGLFSSVKDKIIGGVQGAIDGAMGVFGHSPQKVIGGALATGIAAGFVEKAPVIESELIAKIKEAVEKAKQAVGTARGDFASAFGELASTALQAFDSVMSQWVPPAQMKLDAMNLKQQIAELKSSIREGAAGVKSAQAELAAAMTGGDPAEIASARASVLQAQKTQNDAIIAQEEFLLAQRAAKQQEAHDKKMARQRLRFQEELSDLQTWLAKHPGEYEKIQGKITALLKQNGVDAKFWGSAVGISLAAGLSETEGAVRKAAAAIAKAIAKYLKLKSPAEEGELADLDRWFAPFADTLLKGIDFDAVRRAGTDLGEAAKGGWESSLQTLKTFTPSPTALGLMLPPPDIVPTTEALATVGESTAAVTVVVDKFRETVTALPAITSQAFQAVAALTLKAVAPLAKALEEPRLAIQAVADALHAIGRAAYATRAALQDTVDDIVRLLARIGDLRGGLQGRASGGPVKKGAAYIVGERGPELFVPRVSGNIVPATETGSAFAGMGGGVTFNFPNYVGSREELIREVRRGLLKIDQYNPGSAIARS